MYTILDSCQLICTIVSMMTEINIEKRRSRPPCDKCDQKDELIDRLTDERRRHMALIDRLKAMLDARGEPRPGHVHPN